DRGPDGYRRSSGVALHVVDPVHDIRCRRAIAHEALQQERGSVRQAIADIATPVAVVVRHVQADSGRVAPTTPAGDDLNPASGFVSGRIVDRIGGHRRIDTASAATRLDEDRGQVSIRYIVVFEFHDGRAVALEDDPDAI